MSVVFVKQVRESVQMSQEQLAQWLGCSTATVSRWERGLAVPMLTIGQFKRLLEILSEFGYTIDDLYAMTKQDTIDRDPM